MMARKGDLAEFNPGPTYMLWSTPTPRKGLLHGFSISFSYKPSLITFQGQPKTNLKNLGCTGEFSLCRNVLFTKVCQMTTKKEINCVFST